MSETEDRLGGLELKFAGAYELLEKVTSALEFQRARLDDEQGRLSAYVIVTNAVLQVLGDISPSAKSRAIALVERSEQDLSRVEEAGATVQELREILGALRAQSR